MLTEVLVKLSMIPDAANIATIHKVRYYHRFCAACTASGVAENKLAKPIRFGFVDSYSNAVNLWSKDVIS